jgi:hypothetical protein
LQLLPRLPQRLVLLLLLPSVALVAVQAAVWPLVPTSICQQRLLAAVLIWVVLAVVTWVVALWVRLPPAQVAAKACPRKAVVQAVRAAHRWRAVERLKKAEATREGRHRKARLRNKQTRLAGGILHLLLYYKRLLLFTPFSRKRIFSSSCHILQAFSTVTWAMR